MQGVSEAGIHCLSKVILLSAVGGFVFYGKSVQGCKVLIGLLLERLIVESPICEH
jgi:hypothetical protein